MIRLPDEILLKRLNIELVRGNVFRTNLFFEDELPRFERIVLINSDFTIHTLYFFVATSQVDWYLNNWHLNFVKNNCIFLKRGRTEIMDNDTVINCRRVRTLTTQSLLDRLKDNKLHFLGILPNDIIQEIDEIIKKSRSILDSIKKFIL